MSFKFEQLRVWQISFEFAEEINLTADGFPVKELYNLTAQLRRAADSIGLNIAEGSTGQSNNEQRRFLSYANRSTLEVAACILKAKARNYIHEDEFSSLYKKCESLSKMLQRFMQKIN